MTQKPTIAVHKFSSCDGCQLALLNLGKDLLELSRLVEIRHFAEAGRMAEDQTVDIAFVEGSISTPEELERIQQVRKDARFLVTIGACATSGGLQALRNLDDSESEWRQAIYAKPDFIQSLPHATAVKQHVAVDLELWGCPINSQQIVAAVRALLFGVPPVIGNEKLCMDCKRQHIVCLMVTQSVPCMGPVTKTGCGALCPSFGRDCYACYGPAENSNSRSLAKRFAGFGLLPKDIANRFLMIHSATPAFRKTGLEIRDSGVAND